MGSARTRPARTWPAVAALVAVTAVWGSTFLVVKEAIERIPVMDFLAWRFSLATLVMLALRPRAVSRLGAAGRRRGAVLGALLGVGYVCQTVGLLTIGAAVSGFVTGMFVVFTPLCAAVLLRERVSAAAWLAVLLATGGLALLALRGFGIGAGELLTLGSALVFALHIVGLGEWSAAHDPYSLTVVQLGVVALGCWAAAVPGGVAVPRDGTVWGALVLTALFATAVAYVVQTWAQSRISPTRAAVVMTMEPVFAGLVGVGIGGEGLGPRQLAGCALIVGAMLLVGTRDYSGPSPGAS